MSFICPLKCPLSCFCSHFCFLVIAILLVTVLLVSFFDGCNQSSFVFFYVVLESFYGCVNTVFHADKSSSSPLSSLLLLFYYNSSVTWFRIYFTLTVNISQNLKKRSFLNLHLSIFVFPYTSLCIYIYIYTRRF